MPLYTFYPCRPDGGSETFSSFELADDAEAYDRALHVLDQHASASHVVVWCGERKVHVRSRVHADLRSALSRAPAPEGDPT
jgi:hypothetical protein